MEKKSNMSTQSSLDLLSMLWNPLEMIQHAVGLSHSAKPITFLDLNDYCLMHIYQYLGLKDLLNCRLVCQRLLETVEDYFKLRKKFIYDCRINGVKLHYGQYLFNIRAFEFITKHMCNIQVLMFEQCQVMRLSLATNHMDLFETIIANLNCLKELHIGRAFFLNSVALKKLSDAFPMLTHLTITIFNEDLLMQIITNFKHLRYLNLDRSILYDYAPILKNLPSTIKVLIPPVDLKNEKLKILTSICNGHGIYLERFEIRVAINNIQEDRYYFKLIGQLMQKLLWFQCELSCKSMYNPMSQIQEINNNNGDNGGHLALNFNNNNNNNDNYYDEQNFYFIHGLHRLTNLRVLILKENDNFDKESGGRGSLFDDWSLLKIFQNCRKLIMLTISNTILCPKNESGQKQDERIINRILNEYFKQIIDSVEQDSPSSSNDSSPNPTKMTDFEYKNNHDMNGDHYDGVQSAQQNSNTVSDLSLGFLDECLPELKILQLRGVRIGKRTMNSIVNLKHLKFLRLDSIQFNPFETDLKNAFSEFIKQMTGGGGGDGDGRAELNPNSKTIIHLTNIPLI